MTDTRESLYALGSALALMVAAASMLTDSDTAVIANILLIAIVFSLWSIQETIKRKV